MQHFLPNRILAHLGFNFIAALLMLTFQRSALRWLRTTPEQFGILLVLSLSVSVTFDLISEGFPGSLNAVGFAVYLLPPFSMTVFGLWLCQQYSAWRLGFAPVVAWLAADVLVGFAQCIMQLGGQLSWWPESAINWVPLVYTFAFAWPLSAAVILFGRALAWKWWQISSAVLVMALVFFSWSLTFSNERLWQGIAFQAHASTPAPTRLMEERVWAAQPELLQSAIDSVKVEREEQVDWYFVGVGGAYYQSVFRTETESVRALFDTRFGTDGRSLVLINSDDTADSQPIATRTTVRKAINAMAEKMNKDQDVLFLFLTSHGSESYEFELNYWPLQLDPITPEWLRAVLDESGIKRKVVAISACYSGGFIPVLASPDTVVITASDEANPSFGCTDDADLTYFGRAYFDEALRRENSFEAAFKHAQHTVLEREAEQSFSPSNPQLFIGERIAVELPELEATLFPPR